MQLARIFLKYVKTRWTTSHIFTWDGRVFKSKFFSITNHDKLGEPKNVETFFIFDRLIISTHVNAFS
jgi:hypothetical protein